jgi:hypothetical protein
LNQRSPPIFFVSEDPRDETCRKALGVILTVLIVLALVE